MAESPRKEYQFSLTSVPSAGDKELRANLNRADRILHFSLRFVTTLIFSLLLTKVVLSLNETAMNWPLQFVVQLVFLSLLVISYRHYKITLIVFLGTVVIALLIAVLYLTGISEGLYNSTLAHLVNFIVSGADYLLGKTDGNYAHVSSYSIVLGLMILILCSLGIYLSSHPWLMLIAIGGLMTVNLEEWVSGDYILFFIGTACLLVMMSMQKHVSGQNTNSSSSLFAPRNWSYKESGKRLLAAVLVTAVVIGAHFIIPRDFFYNSAIDRLISRLTGKSHLKEDSIGYVEFSIAEAGFYPLENRLGGPVDPLDQLFMYVTTGPQEIYLRGATFRTYTGTRWTQDSMDQNWMLNHSRNKDIQAKIMGLAVAGLDDTDDLRNPIFPLLSQDYVLTPVAKQQVIFNGGRIDTVQYTESGNEVFAYFNPSGTLYADQSIPDEGYTVEGQIFQLQAIHDIEKLQMFQLGLGPMQKEYLLDSSEKAIWTDLYNKETLVAYIKNSEPELWQLITDETMAEAPKALKLREWVAENIKYRLDVTAPDPNEDFALHVLKTKEGYCTYTGTLLTALCRIADIPARYVEGFIVRADASAENAVSTRSIDGNNAHAWTEIFLDEIGWLPIDGTPLAAQEQITGRDQIPEPTPSPTPEPEPEETDPPELPEPTPEVSDPDDPSDDNEPEEQPSALSSLLKKLGSILLIILKILLYLLPLLIYILWRRLVYKRRHDPAWLRNRFAEKPQELLQAIRQDLKQIWGLQGIEQKSGDTLRQWFISAAVASYDAQVSLRLMEQAIYSAGLTNLGHDEWESLLAFYLAEEVKLKESIPKLKWLTGRFLWSYKHPL